MQQGKLPERKNNMYSIAIDGPAGAGKSTIAKILSEKLGYIYIDTGAMYRAVALYFIENGVSTGEELYINELLKKIDISIKYKNGVQILYLNGEDVSTRLREENIGKLASKFSALKDVREKLVALQRELAKKENVIMDGRDIGTVVLPNANLKIFLSASSSVRAKRRYLELLQKGSTDIDLEEIEREIINRDNADMNRAISPLKQAEDAKVLDTSDMKLNEVVEKILEIKRENEG